MQKTIHLLDSKFNRSKKFESLHFITWLEQPSNYNKFCAYVSDNQQIELDIIQKPAENCLPNLSVCQMMLIVSEEYRFTE